jgi:cephalosporin hydroxylase
VGTDSLVHFGNGYTHEGGYSLQQNPEEFAALTCLLRERAISGKSCLERFPYLEIGSASGGSARFLHEELSFPLMISMDNHGHHRWVEQEALWKDLPIIKWVGDSHSQDAKTFVAHQLHLKRAIVAFIDGDHSYEGCAADVALLRPHLGSGSLIIFHDTVACEGVKRAFEETTAWAVLLANYIGNGYRPLGIGVLEVP